jgi:hypothetical protein
MGKRRKKSWSSNGDEEEEGGIFADRFFLEGILAQKGTPEARRHEQIANALWDVLEGVQLDAQHRMLIWPGAERLDLEQSIRRIQQQYPSIARDSVQDFLLFWLKAGYAPENCSQNELDELGRLANQWATDYERLPKTSKKRGRTRHS